MQTKLLMKIWLRVNLEKYASVYFQLGQSHERVRSAVIGSSLYFYIKISQSLRTRTKYSGMTLYAFAIMSVKFQFKLLSAHFLPSI